ncbi:MAG TPA: hypothetical protein VLL48_12265, partial [Longimicrobiales bacterium]|nr:hypothetical protein [Longimicrobiales bacterium]
MSNTGHVAKRKGGGPWATGRAAWLVCLLAAAAPAEQAAQSLLDRPAGLAIEREPIEAALRLLQRSAGVSLVYSPDLLP